jgi:hypothetical protein
VLKHKCCWENELHVFNILIFFTNMKLIYALSILLLGYAVLHEIIIFLYTNLLIGIFREGYYYCIEILKYIHQTELTYPVMEIATTSRLNQNNSFDRSVLNLNRRFQIYTCFILISL